MSVKLREQKNKGTISFYLDICRRGRRERKYIDLWLYRNPKTDKERKHNAEVRGLAKIREAEEQSNFIYQSQGMVSPLKQDQLFISHFKEFQSRYKRKDFRKVDAAVDHFQKFSGKDNFRFVDINENVVSDFKKYLEDAKLAGHTVKAYFNKFRQVMKRAFIDGYCRYDIRTFETRFKLDNNLQKEYLTEEELLKLWETPMSNEEEKDAFIFSCFTGLRPVDVRSFKGCDIKNGKFQKIQSKTNQKIEMKVSETGMKIYNKYYRGQDQRLFTKLPTQNAWNKSLAAWAKRAEINKHITSYCSRHTFAMMLLEKGTNWRTIVDLMGWSEGNGMKMLFVYTRAREKDISSATENLLKLK